MRIRVLPDILRNLTAYPKPDLLRYKSGGAYHDISTEDVVRAVRRATLGLADLGVGPGDRVGILSENRPEWMLADLGVQCLGAASVPIYPTLLGEQIQFILQNSGARAVFVSTEEQLQKLVAVREAVPEVSRIVALDAPASPVEGVLPWQELLERGRRLKEREPGRFEALADRVEPGHRATVIYTSGTTGVPKGVVLTHSNLVSNVLATMQVLPFLRDDVALSFLPLSHIFERLVEYSYLHQGTSIAYAESIDTVAENLREVRPTLVPAVPRVFEKFHARILDAVSTAPPLRRKLFHWAVALGKSRIPYALEGRPLPPWLALRHAVADRLVLARIRDRLGGRVRLFVSGSAPLSRHLAEFFWAVGLPIYEGYGLTETSPVVSVNGPGRVKLGTVGRVLRDVEVRIAGDGEILVRGPNVMQGYYRNDEANREAFEDGWFRTGDIGEIDADGFLKITDRKKDLIKTSGGKYVAPQPMENDLKANPYIGNAVIIGERRKFVSALLVPDFDKLEEFCRRSGLESVPAEERLSHPRVLELYTREVEALMEGRPRYERVKAFRLLPREFSLEAGEVTPTLKVRRRNVEQNWADLIGSMYPEEPGL